jgi:hypothetical protein
MAEIFPSLENIERLKVTPTNGERYLLNFLSDNLSIEQEVYFQPFLNGDMPDIVIMKREAGVAIIEVKDWDLNSYSIDYTNSWFVEKQKQPIKSPHHQAFGYKSNMFKLHINGLAEKHVLNKNVYNVIKSYVYFHHENQDSIKKFYEKAEQSLKKEITDNNFNYKDKKINFNQYDKKRIYLESKARQIRRDKSISWTKDCLPHKLKNLLKSYNRLFDDDIYYELRRYLRPPMHVIDQGKELSYGDKQLRLTESKNSMLQKVKGVAGSGKTTVLAKRAVNSHIRHGGKVLILTYNKTLRNFIRDKISDVRENFSWGAFAILNYHSFISSQMNLCGIKTNPPEDASSQEKSLYFDGIYSNVNLFSGHEHCLKQYDTILIDEIQDYKEEWVQIIKKFFLSSVGEMVLFGDESQNIYQIDIDENKSVKIHGFGRWERLSKSYRSQHDSQLLFLVKDFQKEYLLPKYDIDLVETKPTQSVFAFDTLAQVSMPCNEKENLNVIYKIIFTIVTEKEIHPNDITIVSKNISLLRGLDTLIRENSGEETMRTFETEEVYQAIYDRERKEVLKNLKYNEDAKAKKEIQNRIDNELKELRDSKKFSFELNSGHLKLSTIHSFKGIESSFVVYIVTNQDIEEIAYTAITRSKKDLVVIFYEDSQYYNFL